MQECSRFNKKSESVGGCYETEFTLSLSLFPRMHLIRNAIIYEVGGICNKDNNAASHHATNRNVTNL